MGRKATKPPPKPKPTADERAQHARFVAMAREVEADESPESFDVAFKRVTVKPSKDSR
jgi:hypothetical protein